MYSNAYPRDAVLFNDERPEINIRIGNRFGKATIRMAAGEQLPVADDIVLSGRNIEEEPHMNRRTILFLILPLFLACWFAGAGEARASSGDRAPGKLPNAADMMYDLAWGDNGDTVRHKLEAGGYSFLGPIDLPAPLQDTRWMIFEGGEFFNRPVMKTIADALETEFARFPKDPIVAYDPSCTLIACLADHKLVYAEIRFANVFQAFLLGALENTLEGAQLLRELTHAPDHLKESSLNRVWQMGDTLLLLTGNYPSDTSSLLFVDPAYLPSFRQTIPQRSQRPDAHLKTFQADLERLVLKMNGGKKPGIRSVQPLSPQALDRLGTYRLTPFTNPVLFPWESRICVGEAKTQNGEVDFIYAHVEEYRPTVTDHVCLIQGGPGDDIIVAGRGFGAVIGGPGSDTYYWRPGYGDLRIYDSRTSGPMPMTGTRIVTWTDENMLLFGEGIDPGDVAVALSPTGICFTYRPTGERVVVDFWLPPDYRDKAVTVCFTDGTRWDEENVYEKLGVAMHQASENF